MIISFETPSCSETCPGLLKRSIDAISSKWAPPLLVHLQIADGPRGFADLRRKLTGISAKELTKTLRALETSEIVSRREIPTVPPRVEYQLTARGRELRRALEALASWTAASQPG